MPKLDPRNLVGKRVCITASIESFRKTAQHGAVVVADYHKHFGRTGVIVSVSRWRGSIYYTIALDRPNVGQMELPASDIEILANPGSRNGLGGA